ncbi:LamG-like jellyroll fold domain-containing protein [Algibacillus agarilyticus]|uniref:LamG-like jellyroll fold domain-containing protein n=1 Tax=Algibacillus agarilyticus TaxID=2234133 RepID=UPI000DD01D79|nr:LamG-like jellyroll fold domain-containing protein [Algibacillus agarilyticus]
MKYSLLPVTLALISIQAFALPELPTIDRDVHMTENDQYTRPTIPTLQTTADGRVGISHKLENGRIGIRLQVPEKLNQPFLSTAAGSGLDIMSHPAQYSPTEASIASNQVAGDASSHMGLCDPAFNPDSNVKNPKACGVNNADDCYDFTLIRSERDDNNRDLRTIYGTPMHVRVANPKTANARVVEVTAGTPIEGSTFALNGFLEPMATSDGRLLFLRVGAGTEITWQNSQGQNMTSKSDNVYFVNDNPENPTYTNANGNQVVADACDVRLWDKVYPLSHAPYDTTINTRYGFAMNLFRDITNKVIADGVPIGTYPWIDKGGDNITFTAVGTELYDGDTGVSEYETRCVLPSNQCEADLDSQNGSALNGRVMMGLWTRGKMVLLDNIINNIDFTLHSDDASQRFVKLYEAQGNNDGFTRVGNGRDNREDLLPVGSSGNTTFFDSNEHRFNYLANMRPITPADVTWLVSSGRGTTEVPFDDFLNPNSFINANMTQAIELRSNGARRPVNNAIQNAATATANDWAIPSVGEIIGDARIEPIAKGGVNGKGLWLNGSNAGIEFTIDSQPQSINTHDWYYSLYVDMRGDQSGEKSLITFPDNSEVRIRNGNRLVYIDNTGTQVRLLNTIIPFPTNGWAHLGLQLTNNNRTITTYVNGFRTNRFTHASALFQLTPGELTVGFNRKNTANVNHLTGWIDDFKVFAEQVNVEVACNHANGTLAGVDTNAPVQWATLANRYANASHNAITNELSRNNQTTYGQYVCYNDLSADYAAHLANIPTGLVTVRDAINFPEGPLFQDRPRPDSTQNAFCLSCHTADGKQGLTISALALDPTVNAPNDPRRQPMQPDARVFGNIPANWLGEGIPANRFVADAQAGFLIDRLVLPLSTDNTPNEPTTPDEPAIPDEPATPGDPETNSPTDLVTASTLMEQSTNWQNNTVLHAIDGDASDNASEALATRGTNANLVWLEFGFAEASELTFYMKEEQSATDQISRWKVQYYDNTANSWEDIMGWQISNNSSLKTYSPTANTSYAQVRVLLQAPNGKLTGLQEFNIIGTPL